MEIIKRDLSKEKFDKKKIFNAIYKSTINSKFGIDEELAKIISTKIEEKVKNSTKEICVEEIQDIVEFLLMEQLNSCQKYTQVYFNI